VTTALAHHPLKQLALAVQSLDVLNRHARCPTSRDVSRHIYAMKERALDGLDLLGVVLARNISVEATCMTCGGTGIFNERRGIDCKRCDEGIATLYFRESTIGPSFACMDWPLPEIVWHSPLHRRGADNAEPVTGWKPHQPGVTLEPEALAAALNVAEEIFAPLLSTAQPYTFNLGRFDGECAFCHDKTGLDTYFVPRGRLVWSAAACKGCVGHYKVIEKRYPGVTIFDRFVIPKPPPGSAIDKWCERHGGVFALSHATTMDDSSW
jgi:hypothetical protein